MRNIEALISKVLLSSADGQSGGGRRRSMCHDAVSKARERQRERDQSLTLLGLDSNGADKTFTIFQRIRHAPSLPIRNMHVRDVPNNAW